MNIKDYKLNTAEESLELTYRQANGYYEDVLELIEISKFELFNDNEQLTPEEVRNKYNESNRRLQTLGQAFELYMKYIILSARLETETNLTISQLWDKWIRGHQMLQLINEKANSDKAIPNFKEIFNLTFNSYYGLYGVSQAVNIVMQQGGDCAEGQIFNFLHPANYEGDGAINEDYIEQIITKNTAIYEKCRYNIESLTNYDFKEVFEFIGFIRFFARMIYMSKGKTKIDFNIAYVKAMAIEPLILELLCQKKSKEEIDEILNSEIISQNSELLAYMLAYNEYSINEVKEIINYDEVFQNPKNLFIILSYKIHISDLKKCREKGINVLMLASPFNIYELEKIKDISVVGDYLNNNNVLLNKVITEKESDVGLTFDNWYELLSIDELKKHPECLDNIIINYKKIYRCIEQNKKCNRVFKISENSNENQQNNYYKNRNEMASCYINNIRENIKLLEKYSIPMENIPVMIDCNNLKNILNLLIKNKINSFSPSIFTIPYNEIYSIIYYMKKNNIEIDTQEFQKNFWKIYESNIKYDFLLNIHLLPDEFLESNGLVRINNEKYYDNRRTENVFVSSMNIDNPLPNRKK